MSSSRAPILVLLSLPIIIGIIALIATGQDFSKLLGWGVGVIVGWTVLSILGRMIRPTTTQPHLLYPQRDTPLEQGYVENVDRNTRILHADGYAFEMTNRFDGRLWWREIDPETKQPLEKWITSHERHAAYLGQDNILREHITTRINQRKGL